MSDLLRIVTLSPGGRPVQVRDLQDGAIYDRVRDSFSFTPGEARQQISDSGRRYGGGYVAGETHSNATVSWQAFVQAADHDTLAGNVEALLAEISTAARGRLIEWRADGLSSSRSSFFRLAGPGRWQFDYRWVEWFGARCGIVTLQFPVFPLVEWAPMRILDPFDVNSIGDYTFDALTSSSVVITGDQATPSGSLGSERRFRHTARGYTYPSAQATAQFTPGATITSFKGGVILRASVATYVEVYVDDDGTNSRLRTDVVIAGVRTNRASVNLAARIIDGTPFYVRARIEGAVVYAEHFTALPTPQGVPTTVAPAGAAGYTLSSAEQASLPAGHGGVSWTPQHANARLDALEMRPYVQRNLDLPDVLRLDDIPGDAPALADVEITHSTAAVFALLGWTPAIGPFNELWYGGFEDNVGQWLAGRGTLANAPVGLAVNGARKKFGVQALLVTSGAGSTNRGVEMDVFRRFKKGVTYTFRVWVSTDTTVTIEAVMSQQNSLTGAVVTSQVINAGTGFTELVVQYTPSAGHDAATLTVRRTTDVAVQFWIDGVQIYEGTIAPSGKHAEGSGAQPPFGILEGESSAGQLYGSLWTTQTDATSRGGRRIGVAASSGATAVAPWIIDPALLVSEDFRAGEVDVEVWARLRLDSQLVTPRFAVSAQPHMDAVAQQKRYSQWGSAGKLVPVPTADAYRFVCLGHIPLPVDRDRPLRWRLNVEPSLGAGAAGTEWAVDYLVCVPLRQRAVSPTAKPLDASYPKFVPAADLTKTVRADLSGRLARQGEHPTPDHGLGGSLLELPPGDVDLLVKLSDLVPDDPTSSGASEALSHTGTVAVDLTPRSFMLRGA